LAARNGELSFSASTGEWPMSVLVSLMQVVMRNQQLITY
jgi:hypothetical protein